MYVTLSSSMYVTLSSSMHVTSSSSMYVTLWTRWSRRGHGCGSPNFNALELLGGMAPRGGLGLVAPSGGQGWGSKEHHQHTCALASAGSSRFTFWVAAQQRCMPVRSLAAKKPHRTARKQAAHQTVIQHPSLYLALD